MTTKNNRHRRRKHRHYLEDLRTLLRDWSGSRSEAVEYAFKIAARLEEEDRMGQTIAGKDLTTIHAAAKAIKAHNMKWLARRLGYGLKV